MTKNQFRVLVIVTLSLFLFSAIFDYLWPDPITVQVSTYAESLSPEWSDFKLTYMMIGFAFLTVCLILSGIGLLMFKNWGRVLFLLGFVAILPFYGPLGTTVSSPYAQIFCDLGSYGEGAILALCYFSPVSKYFEKQI